MLKPLTSDRVCVPRLLAAMRCKKCFPVSRLHCDIAAQKKEGTFANKEAKIFLDKLILNVFEKFVEGLIYSAPPRGSADLRSACVGKC